MNKWLYRQIDFWNLLSIEFSPPALFLTATKPHFKALTLKQELADKYPAPLLKLMRDLWSTHPKDRPSMVRSGVDLRVTVTVTV